MGQWYKKMNGISVVLPAYQEGSNLKQILPQIKAILEELKIEYEILIIDTMKPMDDTQEICLQVGVNYVPRRNGNQYGDAIRTGIETAKYQYLVIMDADGSHNPADIKRLYQHIESTGADIVIGSRYMRGGNTDNPFILKVMSHMVNLAYRLIFHIKVKDVSDSFRIYRTDKLKEIQLECDNFDLVEEILIRLRIRYPKIMIQEIPIFFGKRMYGESKRDLVKFVLSYVKTIRRLYKMGLHEKLKNK
jgi:dolichol-phosphate mannosyltransferase